MTDGYPGVNDLIYVCGYELRMKYKVMPESIFLGLKCMRVDSVKIFSDGSSQSQSRCGLSCTQAHWKIALK